MNIIVNGGRIKDAGYLDKGRRYFKSIKIIIAKK
jgi:hypothetical protein